MRQPKSLVELARKVINQNVASRYLLSDLPLPEKYIRQLYQTYGQDHVEKLLPKYKTQAEYLGIIQLMCCVDADEMSEMFVCKY